MAFGESPTCQWNVLPWEAYRDCQWCERTYGPNGKAPSPKFLSQCKKPSPLGPPWTEVGAGARDLPKPSLITGLISTVNIPTVDEYDPENLITLWIRNPARFAVLASYAFLIIPPFGSLYVLSFSPAGGLVNGLTVAATKSFAIGGWDRVWEKEILPLLEHGGETAVVALDYAMNGNAALARHAAKYIAENVPPGPLQIVLLAIAERTVTLIDLVRDPERIKNESTIKMLGETVQEVSELVEPGKRSPAKLIGEALVTFSDSISILLKTGNVGEAFDLTGAAIVGRRWSDYFSLIQQNVVVEAPNQNALQMLESLDSAIQTLATALDMIDFAKIGGLFTDISNNLNQVIGKAKVASAVAQAPDAPKAAVQKLALPKAVLPAMTVTQLVAGGTPIALAPVSFPTPPPPPGVSVQRQRSKVIPAAGGAAAGFIVAGPAGALVGAGAGLAASLLWPKT